MAAPHTPAYTAKLVALFGELPDPLVELAGGLELGDRLVDRLEQLRLPLADRDGVLLGGDEVGEREVGLALHAVLRGVDVRDHELDTAGLERRHGLGRGLRALRLLLELLEHERLGGRAALYADLLALELLDVLERIRLLVNDDDARLHVRNREVDVLLAVLGDGDARR